MTRPHARRTLIVTLALGLALTGCGKSSIVSSSQSESSGRGTFIGPAGAGGLITSNTTRLGGSDPVLDAAAVARAVHSGLSPSARPQAVVLVSDSDWLAALAAAAFAGSPLDAPLLYSEGTTLPAASAQALAAMHPRGSPALAGAQAIEIGASAVPSGYRTHKLGSSDPFVLAAAVEQLMSTLQASRPLHRVIIVGADGPRALAMPAAGLAAESDTPILFTTARGIPTATRTALKRLKGPAIYAIGPTAAISNGVLLQLASFGQVQRVGSANPAKNAIAVASYSDGTFGWGVDEPGHGLVFANDSRPLDAPAAAALSASGDFGPLLLLEAPNLVPQPLMSYLSDIRPRYPEYEPNKGFYNHGWLIGDETAISGATQSNIDGMLEIAP